jgi:acyl carrier protein
MTRPDIMEKLRDAMKRSSREVVDWNAVTEESEIPAIGFDSLTILDLVYDIQQAFHVEFDAEELSGVLKVGDLVTFLEKRLP